MGMIACYMEADTVLIHELKKQSIDDLFESIEELEEAEELEIFNMDKLWDGLHFLLTGVSATAPIADDLLSEAVVGTAMFSDDEDDDFIAYTEPARLKEVLSALNNFDIDQAILQFSPKDFAKNEIYPNIWMDNDKEELSQELLEAFQSLKKSYSELTGQGKGVIVSIY